MACKGEKPQWEGKWSSHSTQPLNWFWDHSTGRRLTPALAETIPHLCLWNCVLNLDLVLLQKLGLFATAEKSSEQGDAPSSVSWKEREILKGHRYSNWGGLNDSQLRSTKEIQFLSHECGQSLSDIPSFVTSSAVFLETTGILLILCMNLKGNKEKISLYL